MHAQPHTHTLAKNKSCPLCKASGKDAKHFLSECKYLLDSDRRFMLRARQIANILDEEHSGDDIPEASDEDEDLPRDTVAMRVYARQSPYIDTFFKHHPIRLIIDSGATGNMIRASTAKAMDANITKSSPTARQADGSSPLIVVSETNMSLEHEDYMFQFHALVIENLDVEVLAGTPFIEEHNITLVLAKHEIILNDRHIILYGQSATKSRHHRVR